MGSLQLRPVAYLPEKAIERAALSLLDEHGRRWGIEIAIPIPIDDIVERTLGLRIAWIEIEEQPGETILARLDPDCGGVPTVQLNERRLAGHFDQYFGTEQYSLAHEAGHWVLHYLRDGDAGDAQQAFPGMALGLGAPVLCRSMDAGDRREWQAERFAAHLLLPAHLLDAALAGHDLSQGTDLAALARRCGVSRKALTYRLRDLGHLQASGQIGFGAAEGSR